MYGFTKINKKGSTDDTRSDEMLVNGKAISDVVKGYTQLNVSGRGIIGQDVNTVQATNNSARFVTSVTDKERELTIDYRLIADDSATLRSQFNALNKLLRGVLNISFRDEPEWHYRAYLSAGEDLKESNLQFNSKFTLVCPDPYKYRDEQSGTTVNLDLAADVTPTKISTAITAKCDQINIKPAKNNSAEIILKDSFNAGSTLTITYNDEYISIDNDGRNVATKLARYSNPEYIRLVDGDQLQAAFFVGGAQRGSSICTITWRERAL